MADYYPLISRAVAGLEKNSGENRRALYERARAALLAQLRGVTPALNESDITRERLALEESIRKVEAEAARQFVEPSRQQAAPAKAQPRAAEPRVPEPRAAEPRVSESRAETRERRWGDQPDPDAPPRRYVNPPSPGGQDLRQQDLRQQDLRQQDLRQDARAESRPETRQDARQDMRQETRPESLRRPRSQPAMPDTRSDSIFDQPLPSEPVPAAQRHPLRRPASERGGRALISESGLKDFRNVVSEANELGAASARAEKSARDAYAAVPAPAPDLDRPSPRDLDRPSLDRSTARGFDRTADRAASERPQYDRSEQPRMFEQPAPQERMYEPTVAPRPHQDFSEPMLEPSFALDDDRPPLPKSRRAPPLPSEEDAEYDDLEQEVRPRRSYSDLIKGLVAAVVIIILASLVIWQWPNVATLYRAFRAPSQPTEVVKNNGSQSGPKKDDSRVMSGAPQEQPAQAGSGPGLAAVAQKVVLYEEDPADPNGKRFVGSAIWRTETVTPGPGQPPELAIRADVEVPERKLAMTWSLRRNTDKGLPASHTVEIMFKLPADFPSGGISNVPGILMKQAESTRGTPLAGLAVKVTNGFYLIGLSSADSDKERNLQLLKERGWFDIPVVYNNNRRAILAMEKGTPGDRAFADAFKAWKQ